MPLCCTIDDHTLKANFLCGFPATSCVACGQSATRGALALVKLALGAPAGYAHHNWLRCTECLQFLDVFVPVLPDGLKALLDGTPAAITHNHNRRVWIRQGTCCLHQARLPLMRQLHQ